MFRSIGAVVLGYVTSMVLIMTLAVLILYVVHGELPRADVQQAPLTTKISLAYVVVGFLAAVLSGYVTAWVARRREVLHALVLAGLMFGLGALYFAGRLSDPARPEPLWYLVTNLVLPLVSAPLGGLLRARHVRQRGLDG